jgi:hypothetical protein
MNRAGNDIGPPAPEKEGRPGGSSSGAAGIVLQDLQLGKYSANRSIAILLRRKLP